MLVYLAKRLLLAAPTLLIAAVLVFLLMRLVPGDPALLMVGDLDDPRLVAELRQQYGLDRSLPAQFIAWLGRVLQGDLGVSIVQGLPVSELILERFPVTAQIVLLATVIAALLAVPGGVLAAWRAHSRVDFAIVTIAVLALSVPSFWVGMLLLLVFGVALGWLPTVGYVSLGEDLGAGLAYLVMPIAALVLTETAVLARMTRTTMLEVLGLDYITHARSKGLDEPAVLLRHALPNALAPTLTVLGLMLGHLLGGVVVLEKLFGLPGLGRLLVDGIFQRDYPVVQGCLLFIAGIYVLVNLLVDLLYPVFDPRVRL